MSRRKENRKCWPIFSRVLTMKGWRMREVYLEENVRAKDDFLLSGGET